MSLQNIVSITIISFGFMFMALAAVGVIRFPDFFTRLHASGVGMRNFRSTDDDYRNNGVHRIDIIISKSIYHILSTTTYKSSRN